jgi:hypothetical protein
MIFVNVAKTFGFDTAGLRRDRRCNGAHVEAKGAQNGIG